MGVLTCPTSPRRAVVGRIELRPLAPVALGKRGLPWSGLLRVAWPVPALALLWAASGRSAGVALPAFFVVALLWPASFLIVRLAGPRTGTISAAAFTLLVGA